MLLTVWWQGFPAILSPLGSLALTYGPLPFSEYSQQAGARVVFVWVQAAFPRRLHSQEAGNWVSGGDTQAGALFTSSAPHRGTQHPGEVTSPRLPCLQSGDDASRPSAFLRGCGEAQQTLCGVCGDGSPHVLSAPLSSPSATRCAVGPLQRQTGSCPCPQLI